MVLPMTARIGTGLGAGAVCAFLCLPAAAVDMSCNGLQHTQLLGLIRASTVLSAQDRSRYQAQAEHFTSEMNAVRDAAKGVDNKIEKARWEQLKQLFDGASREAKAAEKVKLLVRVFNADKKRVEMEVIVTAANDPKQQLTGNSRGERADKNDICFFALPRARLWPAAPWCRPLIRASNSFGPRSYTIGRKRWIMAAIIHVCRN